MIQDVICESINMQAVLAYQANFRTSTYQAALQCLVDRCGLDASVMLATSSYKQISAGSALVWITGAAALLVGVAYAVRRRKGNSEAESHLLMTHKEKDIAGGGTFSRK
jgi:pyocin large subunit-like protein